MNVEQPDNNRSLFAAKVSAALAAEADWEAWDRQIAEDVERLGEEEFWRRLAGGTKP